MGEIRLFQILLRGRADHRRDQRHATAGRRAELRPELAGLAPEGRHAAPLVRYIRRQLDPETRLLVACTHFTRARDFLLVRHSLTPGCDYSELHDAILRLGVVVELPFESTYVVQSGDRTDVHTLGLALGELCPDESLMITGISHDWAYCTDAVSRMHVASALEAGMHFRTF